VARSQIQVGIQAVGNDQHFLQVELVELANQGLGLGRIYREALNHDQAILTDQLGQDGTHGAAVHLAVQLLLMITRTGCKSGTAPTPDRAADGTSTCTAGTLLTPGLLAATGHFRTGLLLLGALTATGHVGHNSLVNQGFVKLGGKGQIGYFDRVCTSYIQIHANSPLTLGLDCRADNHVTAWRAGHCTLDEQQITFGVNAYDFQGLHSHLFSAHVTGHLLALEYATRGLALANGTWNTVGYGVAVSGILSAEIPALDGTGKALTFGLTGNVYFLARFENAYGDFCTSFEFSTVFQAEFAYAATCSSIGFGKMPGHRLADATGATLTHGDLNSLIAVRIKGLYLSDTVRFDFNHRNRNGNTIFSENAGHTAFPADYTNSHVVNLMSARG